MKRALGTKPSTYRVVVGLSDEAVRVVLRRNDVTKHFPLGIVDGGDIADPAILDLVAVLRLPERRAEPFMTEDRAHRPSAQLVLAKKANASGTGTMPSAKHSGVLNRLFVLSVIQDAGFTATDKRSTSVSLP